MISDVRNKEMKHELRIFTVIVLNVFLVVVILWSVMIYTSLMSKRLPWYEPCGMQFLAILVLSCPALIGIGIGELILGKFISISKRLRFLPFLCCLGMGLPILVDGGLGIIMQMFGTTVGLTTAILVILFTVIDTKRIIKISNQSLQQT